MKKRIYIASPYTKGGTAINVRFQMFVANRLIELGYAPFVPLYSHFQHMAYPQPYDVWIQLDLEWVTVCDAVLRLGGESSGADGEVAFAKEHNIPVFYSIEQLNRGIMKDKPDKCEKTDPNDCTYPECNCYGH